MLFRQLITHYLWTRSFSHSELAEILEIEENIVLDWEKGVIPTPAEVHSFQKALSYPKLDLWEYYFKTLSLELGGSFKLFLRDYKEQEEMLQNSKLHRKLFKHNSLPADECEYGLGGYEQNPQDLTTVLSLKIRQSSGFKETKGSRKKVADHYEIDQSQLDYILEGNLPSLDVVKKLVYRSNIGFDRDRVVHGYFSQIIKQFQLGIFIDSKVDEETLYILDRMGRDQVFRNKKK